MKTVEPEQICNFCGVQIVIFCAAAPGDGLPLHDHSFEHLTMAVSGAPEVFYEDGTAQTIRPGDVPLKFASGQKHGVRATAAGDRFVNIMQFPDQVPQR